MKALFTDVAGFRVVATTDDVRNLELVVQAHQPALTVVDAVTGCLDELLVRVARLRENGVVDTGFAFVVPEKPDPDLLSAAYAAGVRSFLSVHDLVGDVMGTINRQLWSVRRAGTPALTPREQDVLPFVANGWTDREISGQLHLAERSVKYHISNLLAKFNARNRAHLVHLSIRAGMAFSDWSKDTGRR